MSSAGGHHVATDERVVLSTSVKENSLGGGVLSRAIAQHQSFFTGPTDRRRKKLDRWNRLDPLLKELDDAERAASENLVIIEHGGAHRWGVAVA